MPKKQFLFILLLSLVAFISRLIWHVPNFSPLASITIFTSYFASNKKYLWLPLLALLASDLIIGFYHWAVMLAVYSATALNILIGWQLKKNKTSLNIISAALLSSLSFFLITNLAVWAAGEWYSKNLNGLALCFNLAVPFFRSTLASNILYSTLIFFVYDLLKEKMPEKKISLN